MDKMLIPPRYRLRVKQRLAIVEYALEYGAEPASRRFGLECTAPGFLDTGEAE